MIQRRRFDKASCLLTAKNAATIMEIYDLYHKDKGGLDNEYS